jgi:hypothetical protein
MNGTCIKVKSRFYCNRKKYQTIYMKGRCVCVAVLSKKKSRAAYGTREQEISEEGNYWVFCEIRAEAEERHDDHSMTIEYDRLKPPFNTRGKKNSLQKNPEAFAVFTARCELHFRNIN